MQYMIIQKLSKSQKLRTLYDNIPFIFECCMTYKTPRGMKKHCKSTEPESHQMAKMSFRIIFYFHFLFFFFRWASS